MTVFIDLYTDYAPRSRVYSVYGIGRGGSATYIGNHRPWFGLYVPKLLVRAALENVKKIGGVVEATPMGDNVIPILPEYGFRMSPRIDYEMIKVEVEAKEKVPEVADQAKQAVMSAYAGVYNIVYPVRVAFDLDVKFFHTQTPLLLTSHSMEDLEQRVVETIESVKDLRIMSFDIEVATRGGRFPIPGDPIITIQYAMMSLDDETFPDPNWPDEHVKVLIADDLSESTQLVNEFLNDLRKYRPDIVVGFNSSHFDIRYMRPHAPNKRVFTQDLHHFYLGDLIFPHIDLYETRASMGSTLGIRSQASRSLVDIVKELVPGTPFEWVLKSKYMMAEERLDHTKLVNEWRAKSQLFYDYVRGDAYLPLIIAAFWIVPLTLLSAMTQVPLTTLSRLNTGQVSEYVVTKWVEYLGFEPALQERTHLIRKVRTTPEKWRVMERLGGKDVRIFEKGKVYAMDYGVFGPVGEGDFSQLYPTLMANHSVGPMGIRVTAGHVFNPNDNTVTIPRGDPIAEFGLEASPIVLGEYPKDKFGRPRKNVDYMEPVIFLKVIPTYDPVAYLVYRMFMARKITKRLKKRAKEEGRPELKAADQSVKILNNSLYGGFSKRRGFINQVTAAYIFWKTLKILYDVIGYIESIGYRVLYGDTDSVFVEIDPDVFVEEVLPKINEYVKRKYGKEFEIKHEDSFDKCLFPKQKNKNAPSRKTYICWDEVRE